MRLSFLTLQRRHALRDALRHKPAPRCRTQERTQSVPETACRRGASHE
ncbi:DUF1534 domain-containing protein [Pseudomonas syringae pv. tomato]|nr:DUF1534 domain-containing protein [Pseudomonas syringae pv. tomato]